MGHAEGEPKCVRGAMCLSKASADEVRRRPLRRLFIVHVMFVWLMPYQEFTNCETTKRRNGQRQRENQNPSGAQLHRVSYRAGLRLSTRAAGLKRVTPCRSRRRLVRQRRGRAPACCEEEPARHDICSDFAALGEVDSDRALPT